MELKQRTSCAVFSNSAKYKRECGDQYTDRLYKHDDQKVRAMRPELENKTLNKEK